MIITENKNKKVIQSHDFEQVNCTIDAEDMRYVASLLRNNYSNTRLAVVREISANALDANKEANSSRPIEVKLPTSMNSTFEVRDFGGGLSQEDVFGLYSKYGKSTKRTSNNYIGAFGIGKFAPLSYGENFTCVSYHGGEKTSYNIFVDENDDTKIVRLHEPEPSNEPTGLIISVAVADSDRKDFRIITQRFFKFFSDEEMPKFIGVEENFIKKNDFHLSADDDSWFFLQHDNSGYNYGKSYDAHVIMGRVAYPLDRSSINISNFVKDESKVRTIQSLIGSSNFYFRMPVGSVRLHHSRESLEYNKVTQREIAKILLSITNQIEVIAKRKLADSEDLFEAKKNCAQVLNALPYELQGVFKNSFVWKNIKIDSARFVRDYGIHNELHITESQKVSDTDSRNGYKISSRKVDSVFCQDNYLFMIQDIESSHGNNLRVRTLMNANPDLQGVYIIRPLDKKSEDYIYNEWNFNLIDKKHIRYSSQVEKEKIKHNGVRKKNGSRANIPLFRMDLDGRYGRKNADFWLNVKQEITDVKDVEGSYKNKLIFIPIKNYKINYNDFELDSIKSKMKMVNDLLGDKKKVALFGVRVGDVKKLDDSVWVSFHDFYSELAKDYLLSNFNKANKVHTHLKTKGSTEMHRHLNQLGKLFSRENFKVNLTDHRINVVAKKYLHYNNISDNYAYNYIMFLRSTKQEDWIKQNLVQLFSAKELAKDIDSLEEKYPLLVNIAISCPNWEPLDKNNLLKNINQYISLCDERGEGE